MAADLQQRLDALPPLVEGLDPAPKGKADQPAIRESISQIWREIKLAIEGKVDRLDGRRRRKYAAVSRYTFDEMAELLHRDEQIDAIQKSALNDADAKYRSLRNGRLAVSEADLRLFQGWAEILIAKR